jgi:hypothetical protein
MGVGAYTGADQPTVPADDGWIHPVEDNPPPTLPEPSHRRRNLVVVVVAVVVVISTGLYTIPVPHAFSDQLTVLGERGSYQGTIDPPHGSSVSGTWSLPGGQGADFFVDGSNGQAIYNEFGNSGSFSFTASSPPYTLLAYTGNAGPVNVSGTISYPIL